MLNSPWTLSDIVLNGPKRAKIPQKGESGKEKKIGRKPTYRAEKCEARNRIRTGDPFLTMEVLYQLSYPGGVELPAGYRSAYPG